MEIHPAVIVPGLKQKLIIAQVGTASVERLAWKVWTPETRPEFQ
jgi:hypothetical protein